MGCTCARGWAGRPDGLGWLAAPGGDAARQGEVAAQLPGVLGIGMAGLEFQHHRASLLLSGGYAAEVKQELKRPVYYLTQDIAARLQLKAVPSVVVEQDNMLTVREVRLAAKP